MKKWDERARVKSVPGRWIEQYGQGSYRHDRRGRSVDKELQALDVEHATAKQIEEIIGNNSWAGPLTCNECGANTYEIVEVGEPQDYESATAYICKGCLRQALALFD